MSQFLKLSQTWTPRHLLVLDIDSTLVLTHKRNEAILKKFSQEKRQGLEEFCHSLQSVECRPLEYGYGSALQRLGLDLGAPQHLSELATFWRQHFFSNDYLEHDLLHKGALAFVHQLQQRQLPFVYLTGRPSSLMRPGTLRQLESLGFPVQDETLHMKPRPEDVDEVYKAELLADLKSKCDKLVLIDNEPRVLNMAQEKHPDIDLIFIDTCHSPKVTPPKNIPHFKDFSDFL